MPLFHRIFNAPLDAVAEMTNASTAPIDDVADDVHVAPPRTSLDDSIARASAALLEKQRPDGHWVFELEADATIPAEYVLLTHFLGEPDPLMERRIAAYLRRVRLPGGGWPLHHGGAFNMSASVKAYFALKAIGDLPSAPHMVEAREAILAEGGAEGVNVFTRILLALFGAVPWGAVPVTPVEIMFMPRRFPLHLSRISYWGRTVLVPLLVLQALKPHGPQSARGPHRRAVRRRPGRRRAGRAGRCISRRSGTACSRPSTRCCGSPNRRSRARSVAARSTRRSRSCASGSTATPASARSSRRWPTP